MTGETVLANVREISEAFAQDRRERQRRRNLDPADFDRLKEAGFLLTGVPAEQGGLWESAPRSTRLICDLLRTLAHGDSSVALVSSMHPAVLSFWLTTPRAEAPYVEAWDEQRRNVCRAALDGAWWGTITSEPGSGGDVTKSKAIARPDGSGAYQLTGQKHFGSGSGITSFMITSALAEGEQEPDWFVLDMRGVPWDGSAGVKLIAEWDGHGMIATQSHAMSFEDFPATRFAWPGILLRTAAAAGPFVGCAFTAVIVGIVENALETARQQLAPKRDSLRPYEQVECSRAEVEGWLIQQAYEGMLRAVERDDDAYRNMLQGKTAIAEIAESVTGRICKVVGGGAFSRNSPFGFWYEDVRALGFLRPPWGLAFDGIFARSWPQPQ
ncbi:MAG: acyl-CoA dehydrogenase family protein [Dehalococcoidia bacterium]